MASYQIKTQRRKVNISSPYPTGFKHTAFLTEYSVPLSPDMEILNEDLLMKTSSLRIEDEMSSLYSERHLRSKRDKEDTNLEKTNSNVRKLTKFKMDKKTRSSIRNENNKLEEEGYMNHMPNEIILMFLNYVNGMDRVNFGSTCKRFRQLLINSGLLWKTRRISWDSDSDKYAILAPQIGKIVIVLDAEKNMDDFCLDLFIKKGSHTNIIHVIDPEDANESRHIYCWLKIKNIYQKYEIYLDTAYLDIQEVFYTLFIWPRKGRVYTA